MLYFDILSLNFLISFLLSNLQLFRKTIGMLNQKLQQRQIQFLKQNPFVIFHTQKLRQVLSKTNFSSHSLPIDNEQILMPLKQEKFSVQGIEIEVKHNYLMSLYENDKYLFLLFACKQSHQSINKESKIVIWQFRKENGQNRKLQISSIKGIISCLRLERIRSLEQDKEDTSKSVTKYKNCIIIGTKQGYLKVVDMTKDYSIKSMKLSTLNPVVQIIPFEAVNLEENVFYFVLLQNNEIHLINILNLDTLSRFCPSILRTKAESALNISQSKSLPQFLYQSTKGGYVIVWEITGKELNQNIKKSLQNKFQSKHVIERVFPRYLSHELCLDGLLFMEVWGSLVLIVDRKCFLRLFSLNFDQRMDFIQVFKIQLPYSWSVNGQNLSQDLIQNKNDQLYDQEFDNTYQNFIFLETEMTLYFLLERQNHSVFKLKLNEFMQLELLEKIKIKNKAFRTIDQFVVNQNSQFLIVRNKNGFAIKYLQEEKQEQNQKNTTNISKQKDKRRHKQEENQY